MVDTAQRASLHYVAAALWRLEHPSAAASIADPQRQVDERLLAAVKEATDEARKNEVPLKSGALRIRRTDAARVVLYERLVEVVERMKRNYDRAACLTALGTAFVSADEIVDSKDLARAFDRLHGAKRLPKRANWATETGSGRAFAERLLALVDCHPRAVVEAARRYKRCFPDLPALDRSPKAVANDLLVQSARPRPSRVDFRRFLARLMGLRIAREERRFVPDSSLSSESDWMPSAASE